MKKKIFLLLFFLITFESYGYENLDNQILKNLRCLVCQGQTVHDSNSEFALTIKSVVKDKISEGKNEKEIYDFCPKIWRLDLLNST